MQVETVVFYFPLKWKWMELVDKSLQPEGLVFIS